MSLRLILLAILLLYPGGLLLANAGAPFAFALYFYALFANLFFGVFEGFILGGASEYKEKLPPNSPITRFFLKMELQCVIANVLSFFIGAPLIRVGFLVWDQLRGSGFFDYELKQYVLYSSIFLMSLSIEYSYLRFAYRKYFSFSGLFWRFLGVNLFTNLIVVGCLIPMGDYSFLQQFKFVDKMETVQSLGARVAMITPKGEVVERVIRKAGDPKLRDVRFEGRYPLNILPPRIEKTSNEGEYLLHAHPDKRAPVRVKMEKRVANYFLSTLYQSNKRQFFWPRNNLYSCAEKQVLKKISFPTSGISGEGRLTIKGRGRVGLESPFYSFFWPKSYYELGKNEFLFTEKGGVYLLNLNKNEFYFLFKGSYPLLLSCPRPL